MTETATLPTGEGVRPAGSLTAEMCAAGGETVERTLAHSFLTELAAGELPDAVFRRYLVQDVRYISDFVRAISVVGGRLRSRRHTAQLSRRAGEIAAEHGLHERLMADFGVTWDEVATTPSSPTTAGYVSWVLALAHGEPLEEALGGLMACPWVYWEIGKALIESGSPDPRYQAWIERYGGEQPATNLPSWLDLVDEVGEGLTDAQRAAAADRFATGCRWEHLFWDAAYHGRTWPV
jgi:thiaminase/transcriptional activator TenA